MKKKSYKSKPGDFEVRILPDGRIYMVAADEKMFDLAEAIDPDNRALVKRRKVKASDRTAEKPGGSA